MYKGISLVTGVSGCLGRATSLHLAKLGSRVIGCDHPGKEKSVSSDHELTNAIEYVTCDITNEDDVKNVLNTCKEKFGRLDSLVNCAGYYISITVNKKVGTDDIRQFLRNNVGGTFNVIRLAAELMAQNVPDENNQRGVIVTTSASGSCLSFIGQAFNAASDGAIAGMTLPIARDLSKLGIRICSIAPGYMNTPLGSKLHIDHLEFISSETVTQSLGSPVDFAKLAHTIITNQMLNGEIISIDGGLTTL